nr:hypothetical protein [Candidatus Njordarchaeum guaymaensis]
MKNEELTTFAGALVALGILFGEDLLIGYSFIGGGVTLAIIAMIKSKRQFKKEEPSH